MNIVLSKMYLVVDATVKAVASILIDNAIAVHDIKLLDIGGRLMVVMPSKQDGNGKPRDIVHPINAQTRAVLEELLINEYNNRRNDK